MCALESIQNELVHNMLNNLEALRTVLVAYAKSGPKECDDVI